MAAVSQRLSHECLTGVVTGYGNEVLARHFRVWMQEIKGLAWQIEMELGKVVSRIKQSIYNKQCQHEDSVLVQHTCEELQWKLDSQVFRSADELLEQVTVT